MAKFREPKYTRNKSGSGRETGYLVYGGKKYYFPGLYESPESRAEYHKFIANINQGGVPRKEGRDVVWSSDGEEPEEVSKPAKVEKVTA